MAYVPNRNAVFPVTGLAGSLQNRQETMAATGAYQDVTVQNPIGTYALQGSSTSGMDAQGAGVVGATNRTNSGLSVGSPCVGTGTAENCMTDDLLNWYRGIGQPSLGGRIGKPGEASRARSKLCKTCGSDDTQSNLMDNVGSFV